MDNSGDKRRFNKSLPKYNEPKTKQLTLRLTELAYDWIKNSGGADLIEKLARGIWRITKK